MTSPCYAAHLTRASHTCDDTYLTHTSLNPNPKRTHSC